MHWLGSKMFRLAVQKFLNITSFLHSKLNEIIAENLGGLECTFGVVGKILMSRICWNLFGKIVVTLGPMAQATLVSHEKKVAEALRSNGPSAVKS